MEPYFWIVVAGCFTVLATVVASAVCRWRAHVKPLLDLQPGAFDMLAAKRVGSLPAIEETVWNQLDSMATDDLGRSPSVPRGLQDESVSGHVPLWGAAVADGMVPGAATWVRWATVDDSVFQVFTHWSHQQIDGTSDLLSYTETHEYATESSHFINKLAGHMGEWHVHEHLTSAGLDVQMPEASNEPGVDLWVDGHPANVKTYADASDAASHFLHHPDIPIIVPGDASQIPPDAVHFSGDAPLDTSLLDHGDHATLVDDALSHSDVVGQAKHAADVIGSPGPHFHFPWVTMVVSSMREGKLLLEGHTDIGRAAKNVVIDTTLIGSGGFTGAKAGALLGGLIGPWGIPIGGVIGGLSGGVLGRWMANIRKRKPLMAAKERYDAALEKFKSSAEVVDQEVEANWKPIQRSELEQLKKIGDQVRVDLDKQLSEQSEQLDQRVNLSEPAAHQLFLLLDDDLNKRVELVKRELMSAVPLLALPWSGFVAPEHSRRFHLFNRQHRRWRRATKKLLSNWECSPRWTAQFMDLVLAVPGSQRHAEVFLEDAIDARARAYESIARLHGGALALIASRRQATCERLRAEWSRIVDNASEKLRPSTEQLETTAELLKAELRKAGINSSEATGTSTS